MQKCAVAGIIADGNVVAVTAGAITGNVDIDAFGKQAEVIAKYMRKGRPIMVEGRLKLDQWESNEGQKRR